MIEQQVFFEEGQASDGAGVAAFLEKVILETDFLLMEEWTADMTATDLAKSLAISQQSAGRLCLLAKLKEEIIGLININSSLSSASRHIGDIFLAVRKPYWGQGIGQILLEEALLWAQENQQIWRLELTVQKRNERALRLYQKLGFEVEGIQRRAIKTKKGEFLDVCLMGRLIDH